MPVLRLSAGRRPPVPHHERLHCRLTFSGNVPATAIANFLGLLALDPNKLREGGGPERMWSKDGHSSITLAQVDYAHVLQDKEEPSERRHDDVWQSIVRSIVSGDKVMDELAEQRLLAIAGDPAEIGDLAEAVMAPKCAMDGSPMITTQAATVLAAFRHLASIVAVKMAEQGGETMRNLASAAASLDPHVVMQMMQSEDDPADATQVVRGMAGAVRRHQGGAIARGGALERRAGLGPPRGSLRHDQALTPNGSAGRAHDDPHAALGEHLRPDAAVQGHLVVDGRAAHLVQRQTVRVGHLSRLGLTWRWARVAKRRWWPGATCRKRCRDRWRSAARRTCGKTVGGAHHRPAEARARSGPAPPRLPTT